MPNPFLHLASSTTRAITTALGPTREPALPAGLACLGVCCCHPLLLAKCLHHPPAQRPSQEACRAVQGSMVLSSHGAVWLKAHLTAT